jgi:hypothetical protein
MAELETLRRFLTDGAAGARNVDGKDCRLHRGKSEAKKAMAGSARTRTCTIANFGVVQAGLTKPPSASSRGYLWSRRT